MHFNIDFYADLKGGPKLLMRLDASALAGLIGRLEQFHASGEERLLIASMTNGEPGSDLWLVSHRFPLGSPGHRWLCDDATWPSIHGRLHTLSAHGSGHQYLELLGSTTELLISIGEYIKAGR